jgi:hypothetical protein
MKSLKIVLQENSHQKQLIKAVINQLGGPELERTSANGKTQERPFYELQIENTLHGGANCGINGFIYYSDTVSFWRKNRAAITAALEQLAGDLGEDLLNMVSSFKSIKDQYSATEIGKAIFGRYNEEFTGIYDTLANFALEEVARMFED